MFRVFKEAGRPWPEISDDDVVDYMVMEAVAIKVRLEDEELRKEAEDKKRRDAWKEDLSELEQHR